VATIFDVAKQAGVSTTTVSHVLNKSRFVSAATTRRVRRAMKDLDYQPNAVARSLRRKHTRTLGLLVPDSSNPFFADMARGVGDYAFDHGYNVIFGSSNGNLERELAYLRVLNEKQIEGLIFISAGESGKNIGYLQSERIPIVILDREFKGLAADYLTSDNQHGGYLATEYLIHLGHRAIACITGPEAIVSSTERLAGYRQALKAHSLTYHAGLVAHGDYTAPSGFAATQRLLEGSSHLPTAIFALNDMMAIGCLGAIHSAGLRVPDDIAVIGFDDIVLASYTFPPLTTVHQQRYEMGSLAAKIVIDRTESGTHHKPQSHVLPVELIVRESTNKQPRHA
jgi:LacI family transcriptional regulator